MSGHSKWSKIKRQKAVTDKAKGVVFSKLSRLITLAVIEGGGISDPGLNFKLRLAIEKAKQENLPKENIQKAIDKGAGPNKEILKEVVYEAFGPGGAAFMIVATTDNSNRTHAEVRNMLERNNGKMAGQGSVGYLFQKCGTVVFDSAAINETDLLTFAEQIEAYDIEQDGEETYVYIPFDHLGKVKDFTQSIPPKTVESEYRPLSSISVPNSQKVMDLMEIIESLEDVHNVYTNVNFST